MCFFSLNIRWHLNPLGLILLPYDFTRLQTSEMTKFLVMFEDQKIDKMDSTSCHDPQIAKYRKLFFLFTWIDSKYKKVHINRI